MKSPDSISNKWKLRDFEEGDQEGILSLLRTSFGSGVLPETYSVSHWNWKYTGAIEGSRIFVADDHGLIVGHYGFLPKLFSSPDGPIKTMVAVDAATHQEYRRKGLFYSLSTFALEKLTQEGIPFCIGFTASERAPQVMPGHRKAGWFSPFKIAVLGRPLNAKVISEAKFGKGLKSRLASLALGGLMKTVYRWKLHSESSICPTEIPEPDVAVSDFCNDISSEYKFIGQRDLSFLKWRFLRNPHRKYRFFIAKNENEILGFMVLRSFNYQKMHGLLIVDLICKVDDEETRGILLDKAQSVGSEVDADILAFMVNCKKTRKSLSEKGFMKTGQVYSFVVHINTDRYTQSDLSDSDSWFLSWCDFDVL